MHEVIEAIKSAKLKIFSYQGSNGRIYSLIGATEYHLRQEAHRIKFDLILEPHKIQQDSERSGWNFGKNYEGLYAPFNKNCYTLYQKYTIQTNRQHPNILFTTPNRLKLTRSIIEAEEIFKGDGYN